MVLVMLKKKQAGKTWAYVTEKEKQAKEMKKLVFLHSACGVFVCYFLLGLCVCVCVFPLRKRCVLFVCVSECVCVFLSHNDCSIP